MYQATKRILDLSFATLGLVLVLPCFILVAVFIKRDSRGPVLYRGTRAGKDGKPFQMLKFRTMVQNAEQIGASSTPADDPRITCVGHFLRKYKLDELPQLINVLKGEMSLVGPRPEVQRFVGLYTEEEKAILTVRPGITDWASLWDRDEGALLAGSTDPDQDYLEKIRPEKIRLQLKYVRERSLRNDLVIIARTVKTVLAR